MNKIIHFFLIVFLISIHSFFLKSQGTFDVIPVTDGQQSQLYDVFPDSSFIYVIGDLLDSTILPPNPTIAPWWGVFDYNGTLVNKKVLFIENLSNKIGVYGTRIIKNLNGNFIYVPQVYNDSGHAECLVLEIEPQSGNIIHHKIIGNPVYSSKYIVPRWVTIDPFHKGNILLAAMTDSSNIYRGIIFSIDPQFNVTQTILIEDNGSLNYNSYLEAESDSTFILIGESKKTIVDFTSPFFMRVKSNGEILTFHLAHGIPDKDVGFFLSENMSIRRDINGNWIFSALSYFPGWHTIPYVFSYDSEFENMNWAINFSADKNNTTQQNNLFGGDYDEINRTYVIVGDNSEENDSYIFKTNDVGDSLWTRHFIPLNWKPENVGFGRLIDVKATPYHSYVSVGLAVGRPDFLWKSWAILIDSFGCIVPGCQNTVSNEEISSVNHELFSFYPNPSSTFVGMLCNQNIDSKVRVSVFDLNARIIESISIFPTIGYQYLLNVTDWTSGMYILRIDSIDGRLIQEAQIIVN